MSAKFVHRKFWASVMALCAVSVSVANLGALAANFPDIAANLSATSANAPSSESQMIDDKAYAAFRKKDYKSAETLYLEELAILKPRGDSRSQAEVLHYLGLTNDKLQRVSESIRFLQQSIAMYERLYGKNCVESAMVVSMLGQIYLGEERYEDAEINLRKAYELQQARYGKSSPEVSYCLFDLARSLYKQGKYDQAEPLFKQVIAIDSTAKPNEGGDLAADLESLGRLYFRQGRFADAEPLFKRAIAMREKEGDAEELAFSYNYLAELYSDQARYSEAEPLYVKVVKLAEREPSNSMLSIYLGNLGLMHLEQKRFPEAEVYFNRALAIAQQRGSSSRARFTALENLAELNRVRQRYHEAKGLFEQAIQVAEKAFGPNSPILVEPLHFSGLNYISLNDYASAEKLFVRSLSLSGKELTPIVANRLTNMGILCQQQSKFVEAEIYFKKAQAINFKFYGKRKNASFVQLQAEREQWGLANRCQQRLKTFAEFTTVLGVPLPPIDAPHQDWQTKASTLQKSLDMMASKNMQNSLAHAEGLQLLSYCLTMASPDALIVPNILQSLSIKEKLLGEKNISTIEGRLQATLYFQSLGGFVYKFADKCESDLLAVTDSQLDTNKRIVDSKKFQGTTNDDLERLSADLLCLGYVLAGANNHSNIKELVQRTIAVAQHLENPIKRVELLRKISVLNELTGEYGTARDVLTVAKDACTNDAKLSFSVQLDFARLALMQGDFEAAEDAGQAALKTGKELFSAGSPDLLKCYELLGQAEASRGKISEAINDTQMVLSAAAGTTETAKLSRAVTQTQLGSLFIQDRKWPDAERVLKESLAATEGSHDTALNIQTAKTYSALGSLYARQNVMQESASCYAKAIDIFRSNLNRELVPPYVRALNGSAAALLALGDTETARTRVFTSADSIKEYIDHVFSQLSFGEQCAFVKLADEESGALFAICKDDKTAVQKAYAYAAGWKGLLVESLKAQSQLIQTAQKKPELAIILDELSTKRRLLAGVSQNYSDSARTAAKELEHRVEALEQKLQEQGGTSVRISLPLVEKGTTYISDMLKSDEAFVDILYVRPPDSDKTDIAAAIITRDGFQFVDLGSGKELTGLVNSWRNSVTGEIATQASPDRSVRDLSLDASRQDSTNTITYADATNKLRAGVWTKISTLLSPSIKKIFLCSEGSLARIPWGAIVNDGRLVAEVDSPSEFESLQHRARVIGAAKVFIAGDIDFNDPLNRVSDLNGTKIEMQEIEKLARVHQMPVLALGRQNATKENVTRALSDASFAHLATHGFTRASATEIGEGARAANITVNGASRTYARNPLLDTGLFMAFPQSSKRQSTQEEPGILTASEIVGLDLTGCDLISLSACQTGLGRDLGGQGILGLRSAIISAGSQSVLMSMWKVDDAATQELMHQFYKNLWEGGMSKAESLRVAQEAIKTDKAHPEWAQPKYWAAWTIVGRSW